MSQSIFSTHSADVELRLDCGEHGMLELSSVTPESVFATATLTIPPCEADLIVIVDGQLTRTRVNLIAGYKAGERSATALPVDDIAPF